MVVLLTLVVFAVAVFFLLRLPGGEPHFPQRSRWWVFDIADALIDDESPPTLFADSSSFDPSAGDVVFDLADACDVSDVVDTFCDTSDYCDSGDASDFCSSDD